tara:strand:+ start:88 stop:357 length:270 start_codon:yes stop_codon:yes gene_type:complete
MKIVLSFVVLLQITIIWQLYNHNHEHNHQHVHDEYVNKNYHSHQGFALEEELKTNHRHSSRLNGAYFEQQVGRFIEGHCHTEESSIYCN